MNAPKTSQEFLFDRGGVFILSDQPIRGEIDLNENLSRLQIPRTLGEWSCGEVQPEVVNCWPISWIP